MDRSINPARIDFVSLRLFCAVARTGSISKGAQEAHLALSAASRRLSDMEAAFGTLLLERSARGVQLTAAGHTALQHSLRLFQGLEQFSSDLSDYARGLRGHVRLWANMSALTEFLPTALAGFLAQHQDIQIDTEEQLSGDIARALADGLADLGVLAEGTSVRALHVLPFRQDTLVVICAADHPMARQRQVRFAECLAHDFVGLNRGSSLLELTLREAEQAGGRLHTRVQVRSFDAMCHMIAAGLGLGVVPLAACQSQIRSLGLRVLSLTDAWASRQLLLACRSLEALSPPARLLHQFLRSPAGSAVPSLQRGA